MTIFIGGGCHTLIMEPSKVIGEQMAAILERFPDNTTSRVRTVSEALLMLAVNDPPIDQVCIDGQVWSIEQALLIFSRM